MPEKRKPAKKPATRSAPADRAKSHPAAAKTRTGSSPPAAARPESPTAKATPKSADPSTSTPATRRADPDGRRPAPSAPQPIDAATDEQIADVDAADELADAQALADIGLGGFTGLASAGSGDGDGQPTPTRRFDALICDIDGCLTPESNELFDLGALRRIADHNHAAIKSGDRPVVTLCSGRPQPFVEAITRMIGNTLLPCIAENGVWLYFPATNEYLRDPSITRDHLRAVHQAAEWVEAELFPQGFSIQPGKSASISLYHHDSALLPKMMPTIEAAFKKHGWPLRVTKTWHYINCDLDHISKATGLDWLIASAGLNPDRLAGFGDTMSDMAIAQRVKFFACPPKHDEGLEAVAHHISPYWQAWAVLDVIERVLNEYEG
jgi:hydroxymethylpyrimidine pyrophosphatase-like HAD family hydrolase